MQKEQAYYFNSWSITKPSIIQLRNKVKIQTSEADKEAEEAKIFSKQQLLESLQNFLEILSSEVVFHELIIFNWLLKVSESTFYFPHDLCISFLSFLFWVNLVNSRNDSRSFKCSRDSPNMERVGMSDKFSLGMTKQETNRSTRSIAFLAKSTNGHISYFVPF